jgi:hypothetical protein
MKISIMHLETSLLWVMNVPTGKSKLSKNT